MRRLLCIIIVIFTLILALPSRQNILADSPTGTPSDTGTGKWVAMPMTSGTGDNVGNAVLLRTDEVVWDGQHNERPFLVVGCLNKTFNVIIVTETIINHNDNGLMPIFYQLDNEAARQQNAVMGTDYTSFSFTSSIKMVGRMEHFKSLKVVFTSSYQKQGESPMALVFDIRGLANADQKVKDDCGVVTTYENETPGPTFTPTTDRADYVPCGPGYRFTTPTLTLTASITPTITRTPTNTPIITRTATLTSTPCNTKTPTPTRTPSDTYTPRPTLLPTFPPAAVQSTNPPVATSSKAQASCGVSTPSDDGGGPTALCKDGVTWCSGTIHQGACAHHSGVSTWYR